MVLIKPPPSRALYFHAKVPTTKKDQQTPKNKAIVDVSRKAYQRPKKM